MPDVVKNLFEQLQRDSWRETNGFSDDIKQANEKLFRESTTDLERGQILNEWLKDNQPCTFGRIAAIKDKISYSILTEQDLRGSDEKIRDKIKKDHLKWTAATYKGEKSAFIIFVLSSTIAYAEPNEVMKQLAIRLCSLYLKREVVPDDVFFDSAFLEIPSQSEGFTFKWDNGVNYFCSQGDNRWWHDHRIPGGMAFSMNSIGHMVKSTIVANRMSEIYDLLDVNYEEGESTRIDSVEKVLSVAMQIISKSAITISGKATELLPLPEDRSSLPQCPVKLPRNLEDKNYCTYQGYFNTDFTIPSIFFRPDVERPSDAIPSQLDFTYIFHDEVDNFDHERIMRGEQIRASEGSEEESEEFLGFVSNNKRRKAKEQIVQIVDCELLVEALKE